MSKGTAGRALLPERGAAWILTFLLTVMLSDDMVKERSLNAGQMVREAAKLIQGGGGGQPHFASAGGKNLDGITAAVEKIIEMIKN